jgi:hypothetical protein
VWRLDRLGRSLGDLIHLTHEFKARGVGFASLTEQIDTRSPTGQAQPQRAEDDPHPAALERSARPGYRRAVRGESIDRLQKHDRVHRRLTPGDEKTMTAQRWSSEGYAKNARFVTDLGTPVLELLAPRPGEHILDVGCGDGVLTKKIADLGCSVVGVDSSADFVASARKLGLTVVQKNASDMDFGPSFDAVFSNG